MIEMIREHFAPGPLFGWLCLIFIGSIPLVWWRACAPRNFPTVRFSSLRLFDGLEASWVSRTWFLPPLLRTLGILCLIVAMARPQSSGAYTATREGIAIQMVLDVSGSMAEQDFVIDGMPARRLDAVKQVFEDFVLGHGGLAGRENDLIGMTTFAMYADTTCPLTLDHASLIELLRATDIPGWIDGRQIREHPEAGYTSLGDALALAADTLRRAGEKAAAGVPGAEPAQSRVMILLTDGKDNPPPTVPGQMPPPSPVEAAKIAAALGIKIYTIGAVGSAHGQARRRFLFMPRAEVDEATLNEIARVTGGAYFRATDTESLLTIYNQIDRLERQRTGERTYHDNIRASFFAMAAGLSFLMVEWLLVNTRYRRLP